MPSFSTMTKFRSDHTDLLAGLFTNENLVEMKDVAFDGTKILASASKRKAMSYDRMCAKVLALHEEIQALKAERRRADVRRQKEIEEELDFKCEKICQDSSS
jgi:hypothetical protein